MTEIETKDPAIVNASKEQGGQEPITNRIVGKVESRRTTSASFTNNIQDDDPHPDD